MNTKLLLSILASLSFFYTLKAQCELPENKVTSTLQNDYRISNTITFGNFYSTDDIKPDLYYAHPIIPAFSTFSLRGLWMGGFDSSGNLKVAASDYGGRNTDYQQGPILELEPADQEAFCIFYNRIWTVTDEAIVELRNNFTSGQISLSDIPVDILEWPAKNNPHNGQFAVDYDMAPFFDFNFDGIYDPIDGDYPVAIEENPDFAAYAFNFTVYNDNRIHSLSQGNGVTMELHHIKYLTQ